MSLLSLLMAVVVVLLAGSSLSTVHGSALVDSCSLSFAQFDDADNMVYWNKVVWQSGTTPLDIKMPTQLTMNQAVICPANCTSQLSASHTSTRTSASISPVLGSYPYSPSSPICLAAIHAGIIADSIGGGVLVSRFYRHDWSATTNQTIYPFDAWRGSLSNGVLSGDVDSSSYDVPAGSREWSYTVRGRGDFVVQRRQAPFSPRAGHAHQAFIQRYAYPNGTFTHFTVHLVAGGYNGSHYLNDVHVATARLDAVGEDMTWYQLEDAPFTPRSEVLVARFVVPQPLLSLFLVAGQTSHACGLYELGVCSREVWMVNMSVDAFSGVPSILWTSRAALPDAMASRCGSAVASGFDNFNNEYGRYVLIAGQLSYSDSSCSTPPITVSEQWLMNVSTQSVTRIADAPFSPRRWNGGGGARTVVGGIRHVNISLTAAGVVRLSGSEVYADGWICGSSLGCYRRSTADSEGIRPDFRVQVPTSAGAFYSTLAMGKPIYSGTDWTAALSFGGVLPAAALEQWRNTHEVVVNATMVIDDDDKMESSIQMRFRAVLNETELNNPDSSYALGAGWATGYGFLPLTVESHRVSVSLHERPRVFADSVNDSSWWTPMAASSNATRRPRHNFDLRRRDHSATALWLPLWRKWPYALASWISTSSQWVSGGRSGSQYYNDIVLSLPQRCLLPNDSSYHQALGPVQTLPVSDSQWTLWFQNSAMMGASVTAFCPTGYHFDPPSFNNSAQLFCHADSMWIDPVVHTVRRCVRDPLNSTVPSAIKSGPHIRARQSVLIS